MYAGEIQEFKQELNSLDKSKRKDAVKKVIAGTLRLQKCARMIKIFF